MAATKSKGALRLRGPLMVAILAFLSTALMGCEFMDTLERIFRWFPTIGYPTTITTTTTTLCPGCTTTVATTLVPPVTTTTTVTSTTATSTTTTVTTTVTSTTTTTPVPEATINGEFDTTVNDPQAFVNDPDVEQAMIETIANVTDVEEDQVEVEMAVVPVVVSFLQGRRLGSGRVRVTYEIRVPETNGTDGGDGGDGSTGGGGGSGGSTTTVAPVVRITPEQVQAKLNTVSKTALQTVIATKIAAKKVVAGLTNPFTVAVARKTNPRVVHPWATVRTSRGTTTEITTTTMGTTTLLPRVSRNQTADANFLMKASFGPTRASLAEIGNMPDHQTWVLQQMALPVGSHREYYRERIASRMTTANQVTGPRPACEKGSRWRGTAFGVTDVGKAVTVQGGKIYIDGVHVSDIDPNYSGNQMAPPISCDNVIPGGWIPQGKDCVNHAARYTVPQKCWQGVRADWDVNKYCRQTCFDGGSAYPGDDCSVGWPNLNFVGYICNVRDVVGGWLRLSTSSNCAWGTYTAMLNPAVWLSDPPAGTSAERTAEGVAFGVGDAGKAVTVQGNKIYVDGVHVSDVDPNYSGNQLSTPITCTNEIPGNWGWQGKDCENHARVYVVPQNCFQGVRSDWDEQRFCQQTCFDGGSGFPGDDCSVGWPNLNFTGYICTMRAGGVGSWIRLSTSSACTGSFTAMLNPGIWFKVPFQVLQDSNIIMAEAPANCTFSNIVQTDVEAAGGRFYLHDPRSKIITNTLESPAAKSSWTGTACVSAPKSFLNEKVGCRVVAGSAGCSPLQMRRAQFSLNSSSIKRLSAVAQRQVFTIRGLRPTSGPCNRPSRWRLLDCAGCRTPTALAEADAAALQEALLEAESQGWLREIEVACKDVSAGTVVNASSGRLFEHVHDDEYNVYDFSEVEEATNWTVQGEEIHYPEGADVSRWDDGVGRLATRTGFLGRLGSDVRLENLRPTFHVGRLFDLFSTEHSTGSYSIICGSPGEVENKPMKGHHHPMWMEPLRPEVGFDGGPHGSMEGVWYQTKKSIIVSKAIKGEDQLRQKMAWALSQIITLADSTTETNLVLQTEVWLQFYDIYVRHAFGNFRDILREMTYSPIMGHWLTFINNKAVDVDGLFPDENYAREIMQVFSIGLWKLHRNGSRIKDENGDDVRTYENWNILDFAKVFTGLTKQAKRGNIEETNADNYLDPMKMQASWHDTSPKANLDMGYLGDGYPLCNDLPQGSFLHAGAKFSFIGSSSNEMNILELSQGSPLFAKLCNASAAPCSFPVTVELEASLQCQGDECTVAHKVEIVKVADGYYEYAPPPCVYPHFWDTGRYTRKYRRNTLGTWQSSRHTKCMEQTATKAAGVACCKGCTNNPNGWMINNGLTCEEANRIHTWLFPQRCRNSGWASYKSCMKTCWEVGLGYYGYDGELYNCSEGDWQYQRLCAYDGEKVTYPEAERRCAAIGMKPCQDFNDYTGTCNYVEDYLWSSQKCSTVKVIVHVDGRVSLERYSLEEKNKFPVMWKNGFPEQNETGGCPRGCTPEGEGCKCPAAAGVYRAFDAIPSRTDLLTKLKVGAWPPTIACTSGCGGEVEAYSASGTIDEATVFKYDGRYFKNVEHRVNLPEHSFRNPPTFTFKNWDNPKAANDEVEAIIDHLFHHENTPQFMAQRLIQRFTTSNPSGTYVYDVQAAFRTGYFNGTRYSGQYGDLGATAAAIVLHPEAMKVSNETGALREPLLKMIHFFRAMEYRTTNDRELQFNGLMSKVGQWPMSAEDVFNFYHPEYLPENFPNRMVGPEFQIFTMPNVIGYLNGMTSSLVYGLGNCGGGFGWSQGTCGGGGSFTFTEAQAGNRDDTIAELDLLLAGGHLGNHSKAVLAYEYDQAAAGQKLQAAQFASMVVPAFASLGDARIPATTAPSPPPPPAPPARSYRAVVMLYLAGGVDSFQMLVPKDCTLYDEYRTVRESIALVPDELRTISVTGQACSTFGIHPNMPFLQSLYNLGELSFVSNIGSLVEPLTATTFRRGGRRCQGLFSHIDQERAAKTLTCQEPKPTYKGAGGRLGDALANGPSGYKTESFSMFRHSAWSVGYDTQQVIISGSGNTPLYYRDRIESAIDNVTRVTYGNVFCEEYRKQLKSAINVNDDLTQTFASASLQTSFTVTGSQHRHYVANQFKQVARLIAARESRNVERDLFYVHQGGFDGHSSVVSSLRSLLTNVDQAINAFVTELKAQGVFDKVTLVMHSDFGRTLSPNSNAGTDHGWAGHTFVLGGSVDGGKIHNRYPETLLPGHAMDVMHGRIIPEFPWENIMVPIAQWMGVEENQIRGIFPNLENFNVSQHILTRSAVFSN